MIRSQAQKIVIRGRKAEISLTRGKVALIDTADLARVQKFKWFARNDASGKWRVCTIVELSRFVLQLPPGRGLADHKNLNPLDNRRRNLRRASPSQNLANVAKREGKFSSRFKGVCWSSEKKRWRAYVKRGTYRHLGYFKSEWAAAKA
jgi:hypothetical protein